MESQKDEVVVQNSEVKMGHSSQSNFSSLLAIVLVEQKPMLSKKKLFSAIRRLRRQSFICVCLSQLFRFTTNKGSLLDHW